MLIAALALLLWVQDAPEAAVDCAAAGSTLDMNHCAGLDLEAEEARLAVYFDRVLQLVADDAESPEQAAILRSELETAQKTWQAYAEADCAAQYTYWQSGTIRVMMALGCKLGLTLERTHHLWDSYLRTVDDGEPLLPEPLALPSGMAAPVDAAAPLR